MNKLNKAGRPTKKDQIHIEKRNQDIVDMYINKRFPLEYVAGYFNITKARVVQIVKKTEEDNLKKDVKK